MGATLGQGADINTNRKRVVVNGSKTDQEGEIAESLSKVLIQMILSRRERRGLS